MHLFAWCVKLLRGRLRLQGSGSMGQLLNRGDLPATAVKDGRITAAITWCHTKQADELGASDFSSTVQLAAGNSL